MAAIGTRRYQQHERAGKPVSRRSTFALLAATLVISHAICWRATASLNNRAVAPLAGTAVRVQRGGVGISRRSLAPEQSVFQGAAAASRSWDHGTEQHEAGERAGHWTAVTFEETYDPAVPEHPAPPSYIPYYDLYRRVTPAVGLPILGLWLAFLFAFVGIVASDFFCPNLSTIASRLGLSESVTGVTFLAFGNGSPDVFSTFSAMRVHSGSLAIGELIGAASFITSVVAGTMTLVVPGSTGFKVAKHTFMRDVGFFTVAIGGTLAILIDGEIKAWEAVAMVGMYFMYVLVVAVGSWLATRRRRRMEFERKVRSDYAEEEMDVEPYRDQAHHELPSNLLTPSRGTSPVGTRSHSRHRTPLHSPAQELTEDDLLQFVSMDTSFTFAVSSSGEHEPRPHHERRPSTADSVHSHSHLAASHGAVATSPGSAVPFPRAARRAKSSVRPSLYTAVQFKDLVESITPASSERAMISVFGGSGQDHFHADIDIKTPHVPRPHGGLRRALSHTPAVDGTRRRALSDASDDNARTGGMGMAGPKTAPPRAAPQLPHRRAVSEIRPVGYRPPGLDESPMASRTNRSSVASSINEEETALEPHWSEGASAAGDDDEGETTPTQRRPDAPIPLSDEANPWDSASILATPKQNSPNEMRASLPKLQIPQVVNSPRAVTPMKTPTKAPSQSRRASHRRDPSAVPSIVVTSENGASQPATDPAEEPARIRVSKRRRTLMVLKAIYGALFPSLQELGAKSHLGKVVAVLAVPALLLLNLTLPVVDDEADECIEIDEKAAEAHAEHEFHSKGGYRDDPHSGEERQSRSATAQNGHFHTAEEEAHDRDIHIAHGLRHGNAPHVHHDPDASFSSAINLTEVDQGLLRLIPDDEDSDDEGQATADTTLLDPASPPGSPIPIAGISDNTLLRYLTAVQCLLSPIFIVTSLLGTTGPWWTYILGVGLGVVMSISSFVLIRDRSHKGRVVLCFLGFIVAMVWIMTIVNEVVGVLQTFGRVFGLSDAIIGVSIFAIGNSLGDFVANITIARLGYPVMAVSACFGGPMLNILLGIGLSASFMIARTGEPYAVDFSPTLMVSSGGLLLILLGTLLSVPWTGFVLTRQWGISLIVVYVAILITNIVVEINVSQKM